VLLAAIFCVGSAPDKPNEHQNEVFRNNSVAFSRMRAIWGVGNCLLEEVSDGEVSLAERRSHEDPGLNSDPQNRPSFSLDRATHPAQKGAAVSPLN